MNKRISAREAERSLPEATSGKLPELRRLKRAKPLNREAILARQARRLASARRAFLKEFGTPEDPRGVYETLKRERRIFTVTQGNAAYVPSFQFDETGRPRPVVAKVLQILGKEQELSDWGLALWFTSSNGWLDGKRPVDFLKDEPEEVVQAAKLEASELVF